MNGAEDCHKLLDVTMCLSDSDHIGSIAPADNYGAHSQYFNTRTFHYKTFTEEFMSEVHQICPKGSERRRKSVSQHF